MATPLRCVGWGGNGGSVVSCGERVETGGIAVTGVDVRDEERECFAFEGSPVVGTFAVEGEGEA